MLHWLVELYNGLTVLLAYIDAIFILTVLLPLCGLCLLYDTIKKGLGRVFIR